MRVLALVLLVVPCLVTAGLEPKTDLVEGVWRIKREGEKHVDLHKDEFCVDISSYGPVTWVEEGGYDSCVTPFVTKCETKPENVCAEVVETECEVVPYTECKMEVEPIEFTETELVPKEFTAQECVTSTDSVPHKKMVPECKNVTKQNCVTLWETDEYGNQKWAGNDACEPVTWQQCKLVEKYVQFVIPKVECKPVAPIWFHIPEEVVKVKETNVMTCEVKSTTNCRTKPREDCKHIYVESCKEIPVPSCEATTVHKPTQELDHKKKCLIADHTPAPAYGPPPTQASTPPPPYGNQQRQARGRFSHGTRG